MVQGPWKRRLVFALVLCVLAFSLGPLTVIAQDSDDLATTYPPPEPALHQFHLIAGWNLISLPFVTDPSPLVVFADLPKPWYLVEYDSIEHTYHPYTQISLQPGVGYWLRVPEAVNLTLQGTSIPIRHLRALYEGWNLVGYPFLGEISWDDAAKVKVEWRDQTYSLQQAFDAGILAGDIYSWREDRYFSVKNELRKFTPGYGYWVKLNEPLPGGEGPAAANLVFEPSGIGVAIASRLLKAAYEGVKEGAKSWTKEKACGWVMSLLTGNKGQGADVLARLDQMKVQLQDIQASLARIEADFTKLFAQLKQMQAKIIDTILNAQVKDYINRIGTHYNLPTPEGLAYFTQGKTPTTPNIQVDVNQFCSNVAGAWDIPVCVDGIHNAIAPSDGSDGLLDSWLSANILTNTATWTFQPQRLMDYYLAYESYFAGLLFYEYRGVQIYTETLNHRDPSGQEAQTYLTQYYTPNLNAEVDRFLIGATRLVAYSANLTTTNAKDPLFLGGQDVFSRAQFFAIQTRDEATYGVRSAVLTTMDALVPTSNPTPLVNLTNPSRLATNWSATSSGLTNSAVYSLVIDPSNPQILYAGTLGSGVFKSSNGGTGWSASSSGLTNSAVMCQAIDPSNPQILYAGTFGGGVFKSSTGGGDWTSSSTGLRNSLVYSLIIDPGNSQVLYTGTYDGVFKSSNGGESWAPSSTGLTNNIVMCLDIDPSNPQTLYAGTLGGGVFKSSNGGESWAPSSTGLTNNTVYSLIIDPGNSQVLYAGTDDGVFKSTDGGAHWSSASSGLTSRDVRSLAINPLHPQILYAATWGGGVFGSTNGGFSWLIANSGWTNNEVICLVIAPASPRILFAGTRAGGIYKSENGAGMEPTAARVLAVPEGPAYDCWDSTQSQFLGPSTDWLLLLSDFGSAAPQYQGPGWTTQLLDSALPAPLSPSFSVDIYNEDYQLSTTGTILYGCGFAWARSGGAQAFSLVYPWNTPNPYWRTEMNTMTATESGKGGQMSFTKSDGLAAPPGILGVKFRCDAVFKPFDVYSAEIKGVMQDSRPFTYQGLFPASVIFRVNLQTDLYIGKIPNGDVSINLQANLGIWNLTTGKDAEGNTPTAWTGAGSIIGKTWDKQHGTNGFVTLEQKAVLQPGHQYQLYLRVESNSYATADKYTYGYGMTVYETRALITYLGATLLPN
ncbi:MAG: hypothetical protein NTV33_06990 [Coprothermobacterota bacterium]|nr:hypothetical protein [Coprothermobacterota bacterium]